MKKVLLVELSFIILVGILSLLWVGQVRSQSGSSPQGMPVGNGRVVWVSTTIDGYSLIISYKHSDASGLYTLDLVSSRPGDTITQSIPLDDEPDQLIVSGCNHLISIVNSVDYGSGSDSIYLDTLWVPGSIPCVPLSSVFIPLTSK